MRACKILLISIVLLSFASSIYGQMLYEVIDLGQGEARAINNSGQVVGESAQGRAVIFDSTGGGNNVTLSPEWSKALSINDNGQIVGFSDVGSQRAILFDSTGNGNNIVLGQGIAYSINNTGQIVGMDDSGSNRPHAMIFDSTGTGNHTVLGEGAAFSINNNGQIVGFEYRYGGVIFAPQHIALRLIVYSNNDRGQILGFGPYGFPNDQYLSYLFDVNGDIVHLGEGLAQDININGQIIGYRQSDQEAVLFDPTGGGNNITLNSLIDPACGWDLRIACAINDNGWIVGTGSHEGTYGEAFLLKPIPEPASVLLFAFGVMLIKKVKRD
jgi:hypothetical protein